MALGHFYRPVTDAAGNLVTGLTIEVRREVTGSPLGAPYADRAGATPMANPFTAADGIVDFYASGGSYSIRAYKTGYDQTWRHEPIGTAQEADIDALLIPGYLFEFETGTTAPPTAGCIRANNANLSLATRLYVSQTNIAGSDLGAVLADLATHRALLTSATAGEQVSWDVSLATDQGAYYELVIGGQVGATSVPAGRCGLQREGATGASGADGALSGTETTLTGASETLIAAYAGHTVLLNRATAMALTASAAATLGAGWMVILKNLGAGTVTFDPNGAETVDGAASTTLVTGESFVLTCDGTLFRTQLRNPYRPGGTDVAIADGGTGASTVDAALANLLLATYFPNYLSGLGTQPNASVPGTRIDIAAGVATDSTNARILRLASGLTKRLDAAWSAGSGNGGWDTGSAPSNGSYYVHLIMRPDTGAVDVLLSASPTSPTLPANYSYFRRIHAGVIQSSSIRKYLQVGDRNWWDVPVLDINTTNPGTSAITATLTVPTGIVVEADVFMGIRADASDGPNAALLTALAQADTAPNASGIRSISTGTINAGSDDWVAGEFSVLTNTSGQVRYRFSKSDAFTIFTMVTNGWRDTRGRDG